jgi:[protein-PII] uridylyltransferase
VIDYLIRVLWAESVAALEPEVRAKPECERGGAWWLWTPRDEPGQRCRSHLHVSRQQRQVSKEVAKLISDYLLFFYDLKLQSGPRARSVGECIEPGQ